MSSDSGGSIEDANSASPSEAELPSPETEPDMPEDSTEPATVGPGDAQDNTVPTAAPAGNPTWRSFLDTFIVVTLWRRCRGRRGGAHPPDHERRRRSKWGERLGIAGSIATILCFIAGIVFPILAGLGIFPKKEDDSPTQPSTAPPSKQTSTVTPPTSRPSVPPTQSPSRTLDWRMIGSVDDFLENEDTSDFPRSVLSMSTNAEGTIIAVGLSPTYNIDPLAEIYQLSSKRNSQSSWELLGNPIKTDPIHPADNVILGPNRLAVFWSWYPNISSPTGRMQVYSLGDDDQWEVTRTIDIHDLYHPNPNNPDTVWKQISRVYGSPDGTKVAFVGLEDVEVGRESHTYLQVRDTESGWRHGSLLKFERASGFYARGVALSENAEVLVLGRLGGFAEVYEYVGGLRWELPVPLNCCPGCAFEGSKSCAQSIAISGDGKTVAILDPGGTKRGRVSIHKWIRIGKWSFVDSIDVAPSESINGGQPMHLSHDGTVIMLGVQVTSGLDRFEEIRAFKFDNQSQIYREDFVFEPSEHIDRDYDARTCTLPSQRTNMLACILEGSSGDSVAAFEHSR